MQLAVVSVFGAAVPLLLSGCGSDPLPCSAGAGQRKNPLTGEMTLAFQVLTLGGRPDATGDGGSFGEACCEWAGMQLQSEMNCSWSHPTSAPPAQCASSASITSIAVIGDEADGCNRYAGFSEASCCPASQKCTLGTEGNPTVSVTASNAQQCCSGWQNQEFPEGCEAPASYCIVSIWSNSTLGVTASDPTVTTV